MRNLVFVIWAILYPIEAAIRGYFDFLASGSVPLDSAALGEIGIVDVLIWGTVGFLLYEGQKPIQENGKQTTAEVDLKLAALQARLDAVMLEYCPDEMTPEQLANWGAHQQVAQPEHNSERNLKENTQC
jgi:hypothetical protein